MRTDLNMRKGKMCSQSSHASMKVFFDRMESTNRLYEHYFKSSGVPVEPMHVQGTINSFTEEMIQWMEGSFTKVVVGCGSEEELFQLQKQAEEAGIVNAIIQDNGKTEFRLECPDCKGEGELCIFDHKELDHDKVCPKCEGTGKINKPTFTCLAIGPDEAEKIDKITGGLKLL